MSFIHAVVGIFGYLLRFIAALIGIVFVFAGIVLLITLLATIFALPLAVFIPFDLWVFSLPESFNLLFTTQWIAFLTATGILLLVGVPLALLIFAGLQLLFDFETKSRIPGAIMLFLWLAGLAILSFVVITTFLL